MRFIGAFICDKCSREFTIELGRQSMAEHPKKKERGAFIGDIAEMIGHSCHEHEKCCMGTPGDVP